MSDSPETLRTPLHSRWIELRDEVYERSYWVDLHSPVLQNLLEPIALPDGRNPHADRQQRSWIGPPPQEPECMRPYPGSRPFKARARGLRPTAPREASAWIDFDRTTPDTLGTVLAHYRERMESLGLKIADDGWFHDPEATHRLVAVTSDRRAQFEVTVNNFGPTTLIHTRYTVFVPGEFRYEPPALLELQIDHYDDECEILYLRHMGDGQYFALSRYLVEMCAQTETQLMPPGELSTAVLLPDWLPAYPGQRASVVRGVMPFTRARFLDLRVRTGASIEVVVEFYKRIARQLELNILGESVAEGKRSLLAYDPKSRFRFEVVAAKGSEQTDVNLNYWEYPSPLEQPQP